MSQNPFIALQELENQGSRLRLERKLEAAEALYRSALLQFPGSVVLLNGLGLVLMDAGVLNEAGAAFSMALLQSPDTPVLHFNLGNALRLQGDCDGAIAQYHNALALGLDKPEVFNNLGVSYQTCERWEDALKAFRAALDRDPGYLPAHANCGHALIQLGRPAEAIPMLRAATRIQPEYADAHWLLSHALLVAGQWPEGWDEYEWRWHRMNSVSYHRGRPESRWRGESVSGKRILLYAEQGMGDAVQFVRYVPLVHRLGATVFVECHPELVPLFRSVEGVSMVYARGASDLEFDVACPLLSLPSVFRTTIDTIPVSVPYLYSDPARAMHWRKRLEQSAGHTKIGLVWAGNPSHTNDHRRSMPFGELAPLADVPGIQFVSVQKHVAGDQTRAENVLPSLVDWTDDLRDFADTAALIGELDLVIAVDTAVAHVAGAMNKPVWLLVPFTPDWRWFLRRSDSPWYPSFRIFRQAFPGAWGDVMGAVCRSLLSEFPVRY